MNPFHIRTLLRIRQGISLLLYTTVDANESPGLNKSCHNSTFSDYSWFQCQKLLDFFIRYHCPYWLNVTRLLQRWVFVSFHVLANHQHCSRDHTIVL